MTMPPKATRSNLSGVDVPTWRVPLFDVSVDEEVATAVGEVVASGWWSMGPRVQALEAAFATYCGCRHALAVSSGTAALHLALLAVGCGPDDEVVLPSLNFVAAANSVTHTGATPVFCDIGGEEDPNLDPADLARRVGPATRAIIALHYGGVPCNLDAVLDIAEQYGLKVIEDAAHAPGATWRGRKCGTIGDVGCFSFFANKNLPVGEGGMLVTDSDEIAERARLLRSHGMTTLTWERHKGHAHSYDVVARGYNYRLDEIRAAIGFVELERLDASNVERTRLVESYRRQFDGVPGLTVSTQAASNEADPAYHLFVVTLDDGQRRDPLRAFLAEAGVQTSVHYPPIHRFTAYENGSAEDALPVTDQIGERILTLPLFAHMGDADVEYVAEAVRAGLESAGTPG